MKRALLGGLVWLGAFALFAVALAGCAPTLCAPPPVKGTRADVFGDESRTFVLIAACWTTKP